MNVLPAASFLVVPEASSERRDYVPIGWLEPPTIPSNLGRVIENATLKETTAEKVGLKIDTVGVMKASHAPPGTDEKRSGQATAVSGLDWGVRAQKTPANQPGFVLIGDGYLISLSRLKSSSFHPASPSNFVKSFMP